MLQAMLNFPSFQGLEINEKAIGLFGSENNIALTETAIDGFGKVFTNCDQSLQIYCGDMFQFSPDRLLQKDLKFGAILDRGSLVAIDPELRDPYFKVMEQFCAADSVR